MGQSAEVMPLRTTEALARPRPPCGPRVTSLYPESPFFTLNQLGIDTQYLRTQKASRILGPRRLWRPSGPAAL